MEGGYRIDSFEHLIAAGDSGSPGVVPRNLEESEIWLRITSHDVDLRMPKDRDPFTAEQIDVVKRWIEQGAKFDGREASQPLVTLLPPIVHPKPPEKYPAQFPITALAFEAAGESFYTSGYHEVLVWKRSDHTLVRRIANMPQRIEKISFSPDQKWLAVAGGQPGVAGEVRIVNLESGEVQQVLARSSDVCLAATWNPQGTLLATAGADQPIRIFDTQQWQEHHAFHSHSDWVFSLAWDAPGEQLVSASRDQTAKAFQVQQRTLLQTYWGHEGAVRGAAFHPQGRELYSVGHDREFHRWQITEGKKLRSTKISSPGLALIPGENRIFTALADGRVIHFNLDGKLAREFNGAKSPIVSLAVHDGQQMLAGGTSSGEIVLWRYKSPDVLARFNAIPR
jgi:WD40 repeat protein